MNNKLKKRINTYLDKLVRGEDKELEAFTPPARPQQEEIKLCVHCNNIINEKENYQTVTKDKQVCCELCFWHIYTAHPREETEHHLYALKVARLGRVN